MLASCFKGLQRVVDASSEPVTLATVKGYLGITFTSDDEYIQSLITVARQQIETRVNMSFITTTWELTLHHFPPYNWTFTSGYGGYGGYPGNTPGVIRLPFGPLIAISSIQYVDTSGSTLSLSVDPAAGQTRISPGYPGELAPAFGTIWPFTQPTIGGVTITYVAGFANPSLIPATVCQAITMLAGHLYENRTGDEPEPGAIESLIQSAWPGGYV